MSKNTLGLVVLAGVLSLVTAPDAFSQGNCGATPPLTDSQRQTIATMDEVAAAQRALKNQGMYYGDANGIIDFQFQQALLDYQSLNQLYATGRLDAQTMSKLGITKATGVNRRGEASILCSGKFTSGSEETARGNLKNIASKRNVNRPRELKQQPQEEKQLQQLQQQVEQLQQQVEEVQQRLQQPQPVSNAYEEQPQPYVVIPSPVLPEIGAPGPYYPNMGIGMASVVEDIREAQLALKNRGFDPGSINGMLSGETQNALERFQAASNLPITGAFDDRTQAALGITVRGTSNPDVH